jgi:troponin T
MEEERQIRLEKKRKTGGTSIYDVFGRGGGPQEAKKDMDEEEKAALKAEYLASHVPSKDSISGLGADDLKERIKELHSQICKLEAQRYDLEERQKGQEYDLKELQDRQSQQARNAALKSGLDAEEAAKSKHPPKVKVVAKFDRQIDRRGYGERKELFAIGQTEKIWKVFRGSGKPPPEWGRKDIEELENIRKNFEGFRYQELEPVEGAKPPAPAIPAQVPEGPEFEEIPLSQLLAASAEAPPAE